MAARNVDDLSPGFGWTPADTDPNHGGPDSINPLLSADGSCAINPGTAEVRGYSPAGGGAVLASGGLGNRHARLVHERTGGAAGAGSPSGRRVTISIENAIGVDVELLRRAEAVTRGGAGRTRFRHPMLDAPGPVTTAPWVRMIPGSLSATRAPGAVAASVRVELEYLGPGYEVPAEGGGGDPGGGECTLCSTWLATQSTIVAGGFDALPFGGMATLATTRANVATGVGAIVAAGICGIASASDVVLYWENSAHANAGTMAYDDFMASDPDPGFPFIGRAFFRCEDIVAEP